MLTMGRVLFFLLTLLLASLTTLVFYALDDTPAISSYLYLTSADIQKAKNIIFLNTKQPDNTLKTLAVTEKDLNIAANHILNRHIESSTKIKLEKTGLHINTSINVGKTPFGNFLNIHFDLSKQNEHPRISNLTLGQIPVTDYYAQLIIDYIANYTPLSKYFINANRYIKKVQFSEKDLVITYLLDKKASSLARSLFTFNGDSKTILIYQRKLTEIINAHDKTWLLSLADLLKPLFHLAYQRSTLENAVAENRTVIFIVSAYVNKNQWQQLFLNALFKQPPPTMPVYIYKRTDMAQHFMGSAALTSLGSSYLANMLGLKKEIRDAKIGGSGFSFIDLAADRAGMYFGKIATSSPLNARKLQRAMANVKDYTEFMPDVRDLPEHINEKELLKQFTSIDSRASQQILKKIDDRIKASPIYRSL